MTRRLRALLVLGRVSNLPTVWSNGAAAWVLAGGARQVDARFAWLLLGASLLYVAGTTLNDWFDAAFDQRYREERPIPQGVLSRQAVGLIGLAYMLGGVGAMGRGGANPIWLTALLTAIFLYDWLHKRWVGSVFLMGACRAFLLLSVASAMVNPPGWPVWLHAAAIFGYIVGLTFTARGESRPESLRRWPMALLFLPSLVPPLLLGGAIGAWGLGLCVAAFVAWQVIRLRKDRSVDRVGRFVGHLLAAIVVLDVAVIAVISPGLAQLVLLLLPLAWLLQSFVPAT